jgi:predicted nuclease of predicted toxin-antitoxin system
LRFIVDAQLPPALANALRRAGHDADHVAEIGLLTAADQTILAVARQRGAAIITKDEDFTARRHRSEQVPILWVRLHNSSRRELLDWFLPLLPKALEQIEAGETLIELRERPYPRRDNTNSP